MSQGGPQPLLQQADLLTADSLRVSFGRGIAQKAAVRSISFSLRPGQCLAIVGESGSGKSVSARALIGLAGRHANVHARQLSFEGTDLIGLNDRAWRRIRGNKIGFVLQDALVSLDPLRPIGKEVGEGLLLHNAVSFREELAQRVIALLKLVGVPEPETKAEQLPHQLSGGQRQRALIAAALALDPRVLIADEPTTALDVMAQAHVLALLQETKARGKALILISHDLAVVSRVADEISSCEEARSSNVAPPSRYSKIRDTPILVSCWTLCHQAGRAAHVSHHRLFCACLAGKHSRPCNRCHQLVPSCSKRQVW